MSRPQLLRRLGGPWRWVLGCAWACCAAQAQVATSAADFGPADPVVISGTWTLQPSGPGAFDFGPRDVVFATGAVVTTNGARIVAGDELRIDAGATLLGAVALSASGPAGRIVVAGTLDGSVATPGSDGGDLSLSAAASVLVASTGSLRSIPGPGGRGGNLSITAATSITVEPGTDAIDVGGPAIGQRGGGVLFNAAGAVDLRRAVVTIGDLAGGPIDLTAGGSATVVGDWDTSVSVPFCSDYEPVPNRSGGKVDLVAGGDVSFEGNVRTSTAWSCGGPAGDISISTPGDATLLGALVANGAAPIAHIDVVVGGDLAHVGSIDTQGQHASFEPGRGGNVSLVAGGTVIAPQIHTSGGYSSTYLTQASAGTVWISAYDDASVGDVVALGIPGGSVTVASAIGDVSAGVIATVSDNWVIPSLGGDVAISAGRDAFVGAVHAYGGEAPGTFSLVAGRHASLSSVNMGFLPEFPPAPATYVSAIVGGTLEIDGPIAYPAVGAGPPVVDLRACRFRINGAIAPHGGSNPGATVRFVAGDVLTVRAPITATPSGQILMTTRLTAPYSPEFEAAGAATPPATIVHDPSLPPCLAVGTASLAATTSVPPSGAFAVEATGPPNLPLLVLVGATPGPWPLGGILGYAQVAPWNFATLADPGVLGPPRPGSTTDAAGRWSFETPTPPGLSGLVLWTEAYVIDGEATNGLFHQPPACVTTFD